MAYAMRMDRRAAMLGFAGLLGLATAAIFEASPADAKATWDSPWSLEQTYNAATRLVRVDLGLAITERDPHAAYLMFDYRSVEGGSRATPGSIELTATPTGVKVLVQLHGMPRYHEQLMVDRLGRKMREEYGEPPRRTPPSPSPPPPVDDAGAPDAPDGSAG
jgi:hypothetical protein